MDIEIDQKEFELFVQGYISAGVQVISQEEFERMSMSCGRIPYLTKETIKSYYIKSKLDSLMHRNIHLLELYRRKRKIDSVDQYKNRENILLEEIKEFDAGVSNNNVKEMIDALTDIIVVNINAAYGIYPDSIKSETINRLIFEVFEYAMDDIVAVTDKETLITNLRALVISYVHTDVPYFLIDYHKIQSQIATFTASFTNGITAGKEELANNLLIIDMCVRLIYLYHYDPRGVLNETVSHILSREQDPVQKQEWDNGNVSGKWLKNKNQDPSTLYIPNFEKYKL